MKEITEQCRNRIAEQLNFHVKDSTLSESLLALLTFLTGIVTQIFNNQNSARKMADVIIKIYNRVITL